MKALRFALVLLLLVGVVAWFALRDAGERSVAVAASGAERQEVPETASSDASAVSAIVDERVPTPEPVAQRIVPLAEALAPEPVAGTAKLVGRVHPAPGRAELSERLRVVARDRFAVGHGATILLDGSYAISELLPGPYWIDARSEEDGSAKARVDIAQGTGEMRVDLQLALPIELSIKVLDRDGKPLNDFLSLAVATLEAPGEWFDVGLGSFNNTLGVGRFSPASREQPGVANGGKLVLDVEPPVYVSLLHPQRVLATQRVERGQSEVVFALDRDSPLLRNSSVSFYFVDAQTNAPLTVQFVMFDGFGPMRLGSTDGTFRRDRVMPGWHEIAPQLSGYESLHRRVLVQPGTENDFGAIALAREITLDGQLVDEDGGAHVGDVGVDPIDAATGEMVRGSLAYVQRTDGEGKFHVGGLSRATYSVHCCENDLRFARTIKLVDMRNGPVENLRVVVARGTPLFVRPSRDDWRGVRFRILDDSKTVVCAQHFWTDVPTPILLAPGRYDVEVRMSEKGKPSRTSVTIGTEPVELALP